MKIAITEFPLHVVVTELLGPNTGYVTPATQAASQEGTKEEKSISMKRSKVAVEQVDVMLTSSQDQT